MSESGPYTCRPYTMPNGNKWLVHGPTLPELGVMWNDEYEAVTVRELLNDAWECATERAMLQKAEAPHE